MKIIATPTAPPAIGPYSQAIVHHGMAYLSGQIPLDPATGELVAGDITLQTERVLSNMAAVLEACGSSLGRVVKTTVFLQDLGEFAALNAVYARFFETNPPARSTVEVARLPRDSRVEIECVAIVDSE
jgi:2-iminobutanoate/2-iminopropanoate deaminase